MVAAVLRLLSRLSIYVTLECFNFFFPQHRELVSETDARGLPDLLHQNRADDGRRQVRHNVVLPSKHRHTGPAAETRARLRKRIPVRPQTRHAVTVPGFHADHNQKLIQMLHRECT